MKILSLNVAHGMLEAKLFAYISQHATTTDVFCFQETDPAIRDQITERLSDTFMSYHATKQNDDAEYFVSTYVRKELAVLETQTPLEAIAGAGNALSITLSEEGKSITISNVHGAPYPGHKLDTPERLAQSHGLLQFAETRPETHVFIGDFNLLPETESVQVFSKQGFDDLIKRFNIPTTRNAVAWDRFPDNKQLYADYAFVRGDGDITYDFSVDEDVVSDHLPLRLELGWHGVEEAVMHASMKVTQQA